jgi:hypothetical protein
MKEQFRSPLVRRAAVTLGAAMAVIAALDARVASAQAAAAANSVEAPPPGWTICSTPEDQSAVAQSPPPDPGRARIVVRDGTISLEARTCALTRLLSLFSAQTGIRIAVSDALPDESVTLRIAPAPIEAAIRQLLRHTDIFLRYTADGPGQQLTALWVFPQGSTHDIVPVPANVWASTGELERQLTDWDPELRARALEELITRTSEAALPRVFEAFADENAHIRLRALDAALTANLDVPVPQLQALAINDLSPEVRLRALQALEERPDTIWIVESATADADPDVRREAQNILRRLKQSPR